MLTLPVVFSDHMVLQREKQIAVFGKSDEKQVTVTLGDSKVVQTVNQGEFMVQLPPMPAGGPYELEISDETDTIIFYDVMIGEVWLAGGQSNMELRLENSKDGAEVVKNISNDGVRYYLVPQIAYLGEELDKAEAESSWELCNPQSAGKWSAVGYYFAAEVAKKLGVTVGIIGCNWGGTSASAWVGRETLEMDKHISKYIEDYDAIIAEQDPEEYIKAREAYLVYQAEFDKNVGHYYETAENPTWEEAISLFGENQYPGPMGPRSETRPCGLYESMLQRVQPYSLRGFIYYQGEEDDHRPYTYYELLSGLVRQWRKDWGDDTLPFITVQLPMFINDGEEDYQNWPFVREAQMRLFDTVKNTGIAVILDKGEYGNIHPTEKDSVGARFALQAFYHVYGVATEKEAFGPMYDSHCIQGDKMVITFKYCEEGMKCTADEVTGFEIAGADQKYVEAKAEIKDNKVILQGEGVDEPQYARYCWTNYREVTLFGANGIPVAPFRTSRQDGAIATGSRNGWEF